MFMCSCFHNFKNTHTNLYHNNQIEHDGAKKKWKKIIIKRKSTNECRENDRQTKNKTNIETKQHTMNVTKMRPVPFNMNFRPDCSNLDGKIKRKNPPML